MKRSGLIAAVLAAATWIYGAPIGAAKADEAVLTGTLKTIYDRGTILIGYRENSPPFAFKNKAGQPVGFSLDICHGIAEQVARQLNRDLVESDAPSWQKGVRIVYVPVSSDARLPMVISGAVDLECGSTTANDDRAKTVAFSPIIFLAGAKLLVPITPPTGTAVSSYRDLAGRKLGVATGTTTETVVKRMASKVAPPITVVEQPSVEAAYGLLSAGSVDAISSDDILLTGLIATHPDGHKFAVVGDYLSYEPYAIMLSQGRSGPRGCGSHQLRDDGQQRQPVHVLSDMVPEHLARRRKPQTSDERTIDRALPVARPVRLRRSPPRDVADARCPSSRLRSP